MGYISSKGPVWFDHLGFQASTDGLLEQHRQYLQKLATLSGGVVKQTPKPSGAYISPAADSSKTNISVDTLVATPQHREAWLQAISEFQAAVQKRSETE
jgi:hypothetical protein